MGHPIELALSRARGRVVGASAALSPSIHARMLRWSAFGPYRGPLVDDIIAQVQALQAGRPSIEALHALAASARVALDAGAFDRWIDVPFEAYARVPLSTCRDFASRCRWRLQLYRMPSGTATPPHAHFNLASFMLIVRGAVHVREYQRVEAIGADQVRLRPVADHRVGPGAYTTSTQGDRNVHWFGVEGEPAISLNLNLRGWEDVSGDRLLGTPGRRYVDPTGPPEADGTLVAPLIDAATARERFADKPLSAFAV